MSFSLSGNIQDVPLPAILQELQQGKATGTLIVRSSSVEKSIQIKNGQIIFATSTDGQDRLGEMLVRTGMLSRENLEAALKEYQKHAGIKKIGAILVEHGFISPKNLFTGLKTQVKDIIYSLFLLENAEFRFEQRLPPDVIHLQINLQELITEIIERIKREA